MAGPIVVVAGALANKPHNGGEAWVRLSWIDGLRRLGCDVHVVETVAAAHCTDAARQPSGFAESANLAWFRSMVDRFALGGRATLLCDDGSAVGSTPDALADLADAADLLVDVSGHLGGHPLLPRFHRSAFVDIDPGFTQYWYVQGRRAGVAGHTHHFTIGEHIGTPGCPIPTAGIRWRTVRQPVVLSQWAPIDDGPTRESDDSLRFTTVATWRGPYGPVEHDRRRFGLKLHEFRKFIELPDLAPFRFEAALAIHPDERADLDLLRRHHWSLPDPVVVAGTPDDFRTYVRGSSAEFSAAQGMYVETSSGWFSDRTVRYLAAARPALVQDTGFSRTLPVGKGLLAFATLQEAVDGAAAIADDYEAHAAAARAIAVTYFDSDVVLPRFLEECGL
jgi:hypothetical protein